MAYFLMIRYYNNHMNRRANGCHGLARVEAGSSGPLKAGSARHQLARVVSFILTIQALWLIFPFASEPKEPAFDFERIPEADSRKPRYISSNDGTRLALYKYDTTSPKSVVLLLHGGGAHVNAGYQPLLSDLATNARMRIYAL